MNQDPVRAVDLTAELEFASKVAQEAATIVNTFYVGSSECALQVRSLARDRG